MGSKRRKRERKLAEIQTKQGEKGSATTVGQIKQVPFWQYLIPPAILSVLTIIFYAPSMRYDFQFDDIANIKKFFHIRHYGLGKLFFSSTRWISYWLNTIHYSISQFNPISYRIGNLIIHLTSGILVFFILFTALQHLKKKNFFSKNAFSLSFLTAILFLLHPVQTQTVSYVIQGQLEGMAALSIFTMTFFFLKLSYAQSLFKQRMFTFLLFVTAIFSCGTKEIAIISPALILLVDWFLVAQGDWASLKKRLYIHIPLALLVVALYTYFLKPTFFTEILGLQRLAKNNIGNVITQIPGEKITPWMFFRSQFKVILHYLWMFIWPFNISVEYDWVLSRSFFAPDCIVPFFILVTIGLSILKILWNNKGSLLAFGALWFFVSIAPRSSIIPSPELLVDYKTYTASLGWLFLIASAIIFAFQYIKEKISPTHKDLAHTPSEVVDQIKAQLPQSHGDTQQYYKTAFSIVIGIFVGILTIQRNTVWRSGIDFWANMIKNAPGKARAYNNYGVELSQKARDFRGSIPYFKKAISMDSNYPDPWNNLAVAYGNTGQLDDAIHALKMSIKIFPYYPENYNNLASFYIQKKDLDEAEKLLKTAIRMRAHYGKAHFNMGRIYLARGDNQKAWEFFKKSCTECDFDNTPHGFSIYGKVSMLLKKYDDAIFAYQKTMSFDPNYEDAAFNLANAYYMKKEYDNAIAVYRNITKQKPREFRAWYNLGESYICKKQYPQALQCLQKSAPIKNRLPYYNVRLAQCLEKTGKVQEAKKTLANFIAIDNKNNAQIEKIQTEAKLALAQLEKRTLA
ncbi:tetratricopeptide repeat protein [Candidatus Dependentiae bacterium]